MSPDVNAAGTLLPDGVETSFAEIEATMARVASGERTPMAARSLATAATATVVAVGPPSRLVDAAAALKLHAEMGAIRAILVASGERSTPAVRVTASEIALEGLRAEFIDNAIAALRLPSLPALLWWRGGAPSEIRRLVPLADRVVLDAEDPAPLWRDLDVLGAETPLSDLRWAALTRWRALMAHFFDMPGVPAAAARFSRLEVCGSDAASARLFAGWLVSSLKLERARVRIDECEGAPIQSVALGNDREELSLRRLPDSPCVEGHARLEGREARRIATLGNERLSALIADELRVRARDRAFEAAVRAAGGIA